MGGDAESLQACNAEDGWVRTGGDCDDLDDLRSPERVEVCDDIDNDCNGEVDDDAEDAVRWYFDADGDGMGDPDTEHHTCVAPPGSALNGLDDDDTPPAAQGCGCTTGPGAPTGALLGLLAPLTLRRRA